MDPNLVDPNTDVANPVAGNSATQEVSLATVKPSVKVLIPPFIGWRFVAQCRVRTLGVVVIRPSRDDGSRVGQVMEQGLIEKLIPHPAIEALHEAILHGLARCDVVPRDQVLGTPVQDRIRCQFRAVV